MIKKFLERLRHWIRRVWRHGQTRNGTEPCSADQNKALNPTTISPHHETLRTEKVENPPADNPSEPVRTSAPDTTREGQPQAGSSVNQTPSETAPRVYERTPSSSKQQDTQLAVCDVDTREEDHTTSRPELPNESATVDYTTHERAPVVEEVVEKQVHTIYQLERTTSNHIHEHFYHIQPIVDTSDDNPVHAAEF